MPRARRRRNRTVSRRWWGRTALWAVVIALAAVIVVGSLSEINAQSSGYRASINTGYAALASRVVLASNQTGRQLAALITVAPTLSNSTFPNGTLRSARAELQQGLDQAVDDTAQQEAEAARLVPPSPTGNIGTGLTAVMTARAEAVAQLRTAVDSQLGMSPLPVAGAPPTPSSTTTTTVAMSSIGDASNSMAAAGRLFEAADRRYRAVASSARHQTVPIRLPRSVWVTPSADASPLGAAGLAALAPSLGASGALVPFHQLVISAAGLSPPAVTAGAPGTIGTGCGVAAQSTVAGPTPSVLPPTGTVTVSLTVTNCGTVSEPDVTVSQLLTLADPAGTPPPPAARGGGTHVTAGSIPAGSSTALVLPPMTVASGHLYTLDLAVAIPAGQRINPDGAAGTSQQFLIQISP